MNLMGIEINEEIKNNLIETALIWEKEGRYINSAIIYHFLKNFLKCSKCLILSKKFELSFCYSYLFNLKNEIIESAENIAIKNNLQGNIIKSGEIFSEINNLLI